MVLPIYTTPASVRVRLANKVQFQQNAEEVADGEIPEALFLQLICDAEAHVEMELCGRYALPFQSKTFGNFEQLPDHTKRALRTAIDLKAVMLVLMTDFGRSGHLDASKYYDSQEKIYEKHVALLMGHSQEQSDDKQAVTRWRKLPPLLDLALAPGNEKADDGYRGTIINTDQSTFDSATYAANQINNPSAAFVAVRKGGIIR